MLKVPFLALPDPASSLPAISSLLDALERQVLLHGWFERYPFRPDVAFAIAHRHDTIYLKFYCLEPYLLARFHAPNDPVYRDSCVEFFIAFDTTGYYNLEWNCLGTCLMQYGKDITDRRPLDADNIRQIRTYAALTQEGAGPCHWQLALAIPTGVFVYHTLPTLEKRRVRANFQKCGDDTLQPHFLTWQKIDTPGPDFHQPRFFGEMEFLPAP